MSTIRRDYLTEGEPDLSLIEERSFLKEKETEEVVELKKEIELMVYTLKDKN